MYICSLLPYLDLRLDLHIQLSTFFDAHRLNKAEYIRQQMWNAIDLHRNQSNTSVITAIYMYEFFLPNLSLFVCIFSYLPDFSSNFGHTQLHYGKEVRLFDNFFKQVMDH